MRLPAIKRILREDLKEAPPWVLGIIEPVNSFMEAVYQSLNNNITFSDNIASFYKEMVLTTTSSYPTMSTISFQSQLKTKAVTVLITQAYIKSTYTPVAPTGIAWIENNGAIQVSSVLGLSASQTYVVRFLVA